MPDPNSNNDSISAADIDVAVYLEARNQEYLHDSLPTIFYIGFLSVTGLVGNSVVFMVYYKRYHASSTMRYYVLVMSVTDMLTNAQILPTEVLEMRFHATFRWGWACRIFRLMRSFLIGLSSLLLVAVAVDRKQAVCKLQVVSMQASYKRLYFPVGSCLVWSLLLALPYGFITGHRTQEFPDNLNITGVTCTVSDDFAGTKIPLIYNLVLFLTFLILVCIMGVSYGLILLHLWRHRKKMEQWQIKAKANAEQPKKGVPKPELDSISFQSSVTSDMMSKVSKRVPNNSAHPSPLRVAVTSNEMATTPNEMATTSNEMATTLNESATSFNDVATTPNESATTHNEVATTQNDVATIPNDVATTPNDVATTVNKLATTTNKVATTPNEMATTPNDVATTPNEVATTPNEMATTPNDVATTPNKVATTANEVATTSNDVATTPNQSATTANEVAATSNDVATTPNQSATTSNEVATTPNELATTPNELATTLNESATSFNDVATTPNEPATTHNEVATTQNDVATIPNEVATIPNEVATTPYDVSTTTNEVATKPEAILKSKMQKGQTRMFAVLTLVFAVNNMPYLTVVILNALRPGLVEAALTTNGMMILIRSFYINSAVNPIVYSFCSPRFRFECRQFFAHCPILGRLLAIWD